MNQRCRLTYCPYYKDGFCSFQGIISINEQGFCSVHAKLNNKDRIKKNFKFSSCEMTEVKNDE